MPEQKVSVLAVPNGGEVETVGDESLVRLNVSLVFSPSFRTDTVLECDEVQETEIGRWTRQLKLPEEAATRCAVKLWLDRDCAAQLTPSEDPIDPVRVVRNPAPLDAVTSYDFKGKQPLSQDTSEQLWDEIIGAGCWAKPTTEHSGKKKIGYVSAGASSELRSALRQGKNTVEGISSEEVNGLVACGLAAEAVRPGAVTSDPTAIPERFAVEWHEQLRKMEYAIERENQLGAAGAVSGALESEQHDLGDRDLGHEYHRRLAMLTDHPALLRALGLIVDLGVYFRADEVGLDSLVGRKVAIAGVLEHEPIGGITAPPTACVLSADKELAEDGGATWNVSFFADTGSESRILPGGRCIDPRWLDTVQWDLASGARSVLRRNGYLEGSSNRQSGSTTPNGHAMTVFWRTSPANTPRVGEPGGAAESFKARAEGTKRLLDGVGEQAIEAGQELGKASALVSGQCLTADRLAQGFVPAVRRNGGEFRSLTYRRLTLRWGDKKSRTLEWADEMPLAEVTPEARQPLAGWVVDVLERQTLPGEIDTASYLVSTLGGFVVVREIVDSKSGSGGSGHRGREEASGGGTTLFGLLPARESREAPLRYLGQFAEFRGFWHEGGYFVSKNSVVKYGTGVAGVVLDAAAGNPPAAEGSRFMKLRVNRREVRWPGAADENQTAVGPEAIVYLEFDSTHAVPSLAGEIEALGSGIEPAAFYFQGRGAPALALVEPESDPDQPQSLTPARDVSMRYAGKSEGLHRFRLDSAGPGLSDPDNAPKLVQLALDKDARIDTVLGTNGGEEALWPGSSYRVSARWDQESSQLLATKIVEIAPERTAVFDGDARVEREGERKRWVEIFSMPDGEKLACEISPNETRVALSSEAHGLADHASGLSRSPEEVTGTWAQLGARVGPGDRCRLRLLPLPDDQVRDGARYRLEEVRVLWSDPDNFVFAFRCPEEEECPSRGPESAGAGIDETTFRFRSVGGDRSAFTLKLEPKDEILSLPSVMPPRRPWRSWRIPPPGALLRISRPRAPSAVRRIDVITVLATSIREWRTREDGTAELMFRVPGLREAVPLKLVEPLAQLLETWDLEASGWKGHQRPGTSFRQVLADLPVTVTFTEAGLVRSLEISLPGHVMPANSDGIVCAFGGRELFVPNSVRKGGDDPSRGSRLRLSVSDVGGEHQIEISAERETAATPSELLLQVVGFGAPRTGHSSDRKASGSATSALMGDAQVRVLAVPGDRPDLREGMNVALFTETESRRAGHLQLLAAAEASGFPLAARTVRALLVGNAGAASADWDLLAVPRNLDQGTLHRVDLGGSKSWAIAESAVWETPASLPGDQAVKSNFSFVLRREGSSTTAAMFEDLEPSLSLPGGKPEPPRVPKLDQVIADDVLMQFSGWSLAVDPPARPVAEPRPGYEGIKPAELDIAARLVSPNEAPPKQALLPRLRSGDRYELHFRVMDLAGNARDLGGIQGLASDSPEVLAFRPFGRGIREDGAAQRESHRLLRFDPISAPVVWQSNPKRQESTLPTEEPSRAEARSPAFVEEVVLLTNRAFEGGGKASDVSLSCLPPPLHWRVAEMQGAFDEAKSARATYKRIVQQEDWAKVRKDAFPAAASSPEVLAGSVADPGAKEILVVGAERSVRIGIGAPNPTEIRLEASGERPVARNPPPEGRPVLDDLPERAEGPVGLAIRPDADLILRFWCIPEAADCTRLASFLPALASSAHARQGRSSGLAALVDAMFSEKASPAALREWLAALQELSGTTIAQRIRVLLHPWVSTPRTIRVRNVTNQPYRAPSFVALDLVPRTPAQTDAELHAVFRFHRPSTGAISLQAAVEQEYTDNPGAVLPSVPDEELLRILEAPGPRADARKRLLDLEARLLKPPAARSALDPISLGRTRDLSVLLGRPPLDLTTLEPVSPQHLDGQGGDEESVSFVHNLEDTRHRTVFYRGIAHSRFGAQFFGKDRIETNPSTLAASEANEEWVRVEVPATTRPADIDVEDITLLFDWGGSSGSDAGNWRSQASGRWHLSRTRRAGHRIWIKRPWYTSGSGEKVAVLLWMDADLSWEEGGHQYAGIVSRWGTDPAFETRIQEGRAALGVLSRTDFISPWARPAWVRSSRPGSKPGLLLGSEDAGAVTPEEAPGSSTLPLGDGRSLPVGLVAYSPKFHPDRGLWYVDVFVEPTRYSPFVSYSIARYQPASLPDRALSSPNRLRMLQVLPPRTLTLRARDAGELEVEVELAGIFSDRARRLIVVQVERNPYLEEEAGPPSRKEKPEYDPNTLLGWEPIPVIGRDGVEALSVSVEDPEPGSRRVRLIVRVPRIPVHRSNWAERIGGVSRDAELLEWPCRILRVTVAEDEIFQAAHGMPDDQNELPRRVFSDEVVLPVDLVKRVSGDLARAASA